MARLRGSRSAINPPLSCTVTRSLMFRAWAARVDVAYGGMIYVIRTPLILDLRLRQTRLVTCLMWGDREARRCRAASCAPAGSRDSHDQSDTVGPFHAEGRSWKRSRNGVIVSPGGRNRRSCGTGTCARLALLHAQGLISAGETLIHELIIGTRFKGRIFDTGIISDVPSVSVEITGRAWITAFTTCWIPTVAVGYFYTWPRLWASNLQQGHTS